MPRVGQSVGKAFAQGSLIKKSPRHSRKILLPNDPKLKRLPLARNIREWMKGLPSHSGEVPPSNLDMAGRTQDASLVRALCDAAARGDLAVVQQLCANLPAFNNEPLWRACEGGRLDVARYLHQNGATSTTPDNEPFCRACAGGHLDLVRYLHQNGATLTTPDDEPFCRACAGGHLDLVRYLHQNGVALTASENEPLCRACAGGTSRWYAIFIKTASR